MNPRHARIREALDLGLQAWRTTQAREKFIAAIDDVQALEDAERGAFIPTPPPIPERIVLGANGAYWRCFADEEGTGYYSMCPNSTDNDPVEVVAEYVLVKTGPAEDGQDSRTAASEAPDDGGGGRQQETPHVGGASCELCGGEGYTEVFDPDGAGVLLTPCGSCAKVSRLQRLQAEGQLAGGDHGIALLPHELATIGLADVFVRCEACQGDAGYDVLASDCECGGTGFDWSNTADLRATIAAVLPSRGNPETRRSRGYPILSVGVSG